MKKSKINLLINREDYKRYEKYFYWTRIVTIIMIVVFAISSLYLILSGFNQTSKLNSLLTEKQSLLQAMKNRQVDEAKLILVDNKYQSLNEFLKDDAYSYPYYNLLSKAIASSTESASLKSFEINKNRDVAFVVSFNNFNELMNFFRFVESEKFLKNFEKVILKSFAAIGGSSVKKDSYELTFNGKFVTIKSSLSDK